MSHFIPKRQKIVFAGAGDLAQRAINALSSESTEYVAVARSQKTFNGAAFLQGSLLDASICCELVRAQPDVIVLTLVPNGSGEQGYQQGYIEPLQALLGAFAELAKSIATEDDNSAVQKPTIIFASSTGVYHQVSGEWVDENSPVEPSSYSGQTMLQAETLLEESSFSSCCVRFGGIYGSGRDFLIRQVKEGKGGNNDYTNRIHQDDAGRCLAFLIEQCLTGNSLPSLLLACDSEPSPSKQVRTYIAEQLSLDSASLSSSESGRGGNKRCANTRLLDMGFTLQYPSYREGYCSVS